MDSDSVGLSWSLRFCMFNKHPSDADAASSWTTPWAVRVYDIYISGTCLKGVQGLPPLAGWMNLNLQQWRLRGTLMVQSCPSALTSNQNSLKQIPRQPVPKLPPSRDRGDCWDSGMGIILVTCPGVCLGLCPKQVMSGVPRCDLWGLLALLAGRHQFLCL